MGPAVVCSNKTCSWQNSCARWHFSLEQSFSEGPDLDYAAPLRPHSPQLLATVRQEEQETQGPVNDVSVAVPRINGVFEAHSGLIAGTEWKL